MSVLNNIENHSTPKLLLFGGTGAIGSAVQEHFLRHSWQVAIVSRGEGHTLTHVRWDPVVEKDIGSSSDTMNALVAQGPFDAVCWAQGMNCADSIFNYEQDIHEAVYRANVLYILNSLHALLTHNLLNKPARLCVISSVWQSMARQNKLSYCVSKAALQGLVLSAAADLAREGHVINAVLPGVIDTPMTKANLTAEQIKKVEEATLFGRLPSLGEVASCVFDLCRPNNTGVTGQFINVDLGYSHVRVI